MIHVKADKSGDRTEVSLKILSYLADRPDAQDTLHGIAEWWLLRCHIKRHLQAVREAVGQLVEKGFVIERAPRHGQPRYQVNRRRLREIQGLLDSADE